MRQHFRTLGGLLFVVLLVTACGDAATSTGPVAPSVIAVAASGSGGGGGGGGGGSVSPCAIITFSIVNNLVLSTSVPPFWQPNTTYPAQATGKTEKTCDTLPGAVMKFADLTGTNDGCNATIPQFVGATYAKYGLKPMSRYAVPFYYYTGANCIGTSRTIQATLIDQTTGAVLSTATTTWIVG